MARTISTTTETVTVTTEQRTISFEVRTPKNAAPLVVVKREILKIKGDGTIMERCDGRTITRRWDELLADVDAAAIVAASRRSWIARKPKMKLRGFESWVWRISARSLPTYPPG